MDSLDTFSVRKTYIYPEYSRRQSTNNWFTAHGHHGIHRHQRGKLTPCLSIYQRELLLITVTDPPQEVRPTEGERWKAPYGSLRVGVIIEAISSFVSKVEIKGPEKRLVNGWLLLFLAACCFNYLSVFPLIYFSSCTQC